MTPFWLAEMIVHHLQPTGRMLEPCAGRGAFVKALSEFGDVEWCEIDLGRDFFAWSEPVDWIITNPPWSQFRRFLEHSLRLAHDVALMATVNHWWTRQRCAMLTRSGFGYRRLLLFDAPMDFPPTGFQLGMMHVSRGYEGALDIEFLPSQRAQMDLCDAARP